MRDKRFVAEHRGGPLKLEQHHQLICWSCACVSHVLSLLKKPPQQINNCIKTAIKWSKGRATVGDARNAAVEAIRLARESSDPVLIAIARGAGHAVATAHMADHALGGALYALKAVKISGQSTGDERKWQNKRLPPGIKELVLTSRTPKEKALKVL